MTRSKVPETPETLVLEAFNTHGTTHTRHEGRWIEVEHGIPGETVEAELIGPSRARMVAVVRPAPDRTIPPCEYFREWSCGGCQWQHITYEGQLQRKRQEVDDAMRSEALPFTVAAVHALDDPWRYRTTAGISLGRRAGFRRHGSLAIVPIRDCPISHPHIGALMAHLNDRLERGLLPDFRGRVRVDVRVGVVETREVLQTLIRVTDPNTRPPPEAMNALIDALQGCGVVGGIARVDPDDRLIVVREPLFALTRVADRDIWLTAASFFQTNVRLLPRLIERLQTEVRTLHRPRVADVYGGVGLFGLFLSGHADSVDVIEPDEHATRAGERTAALWQLSNVRFINEGAETGLTGKEYEAVVVDPPRSGLSDSVLEGLQACRPSLILYVSCLAQSLARDLVALGSAGYRLDSLELFDFYPQTYHVELLAVLRRENPVV